ncbi:MAG: hypothetical protein AABY86_03590, partial [Bdellovibrionota bacterium]
MQDSKQDKNNKTTWTIKQITSQFRQARDARNAIINSKFFKTGKGQYGEGDQFLGIKVPVIRK